MLRYMYGKQKQLQATEMLEMRKLPILKLLVLYYSYIISPGKHILLPPGHLVYFYQMVKISLSCKKVTLSSFK